MRDTQINCYEKLSIPSWWPWPACPWSKSSTKYLSLLYHAATLFPERANSKAVQVHTVAGAILMVVKRKEIKSYVVVVKLGWWKRCRTWGFREKVREARADWICDCGRQCGRGPLGLGCSHWSRDFTRIPQTCQASRCHLLLTWRSLYFRNVL